ncbi:MAG: OmpA family protein [Myxococcales bacterium]|nr:OmpA family protein [Myxococcales bacterium]
MTRFQIILSVLLSLLAVRSSIAGADAPEGWQVRGGVAGGTMVSTDQRDALGFDRAAVVGDVGFGYTFFGWVTPEVRLVAAHFAQDDGGSGLALGDVGVRGAVRFWELETGLSVHGGMAVTGNLVRPAMHVGLDMLYSLTPSLAVGPRVDLGHVFQEEETLSNFERRSTGATFLTGGVALRWSLSGAPPERTEVPPEPPAEPEAPEPPEAAALAEMPPPETDTSDEVWSLMDGLMTTTEQTELIAPILFETDSEQPVACGETSLYLVLDQLQRVPESTMIVAEGHADPRGDAAYNEALAQRRAEFAVQWLVRHGLDPARFSIVSRGEQDPLEEGDDGRVLLIHRRVTFRLVPSEERKVEP